MKRLIVLLLCILLSISLISCDRIKGILNGNNDEENNPEPPKTDEEKLNEMLDELKTAIDFSEQEEISPKELVDKINELSFSLEELQLDGEYSRASVVLNNGTLYLSDGESTEQIIKFFEHGILTVSNTAGKVESSMIAFDELGDNIITSINTKSIADALVFEKGDLAKTDKEHIYKVNRSFLLKMGKALSKNEDFKLDRDNEPTIMIDMSEYDTDNKLTVSVTDKATEQVTVITLTSSTNDLDKLVTLSISTSTTEASAIISIRNEKVGEIKINGTDKSDGSETAFEININFTDESSLIYASLTNGDISMTIDSVISKDGVLKSAEANISGVMSEGESFVATVVYDSDAFTKVGEKGLRADIEFSNGGDTAKIGIYVNTDEFDSASSKKKHTVSIEYYGSGENGRLSATVYSPAKSSPDISNKSELHLNHGSNILKNYTAYKAKAQSLNDEMTALISSGSFGMLHTNYMTYDRITGIYYITSISPVNGSYVCTTYSSPDAFRTAYACRQNLGGFKNEALSKAESYARKLTPLLTEDREYGSGDYCTYTYVEEYDVYLIIKNDDYLSLWITTDEPREHQSLAGMKLHKFTLDENGKVNIHTFEERVTDECSLQYVCTHCGFCKRSGYKKHDYSVDVSRSDEDGNLLWRFTDCAKCNECVINVYDGDIAVTFTLDKMKTYYLLDARSYEGFEDFALTTDDYSHSLVITNMKVNGDRTTQANIEIVIPKLSEYCEYSIVGIDYSRDMYQYEFLTMQLVIPEGVEFINEGAFLQVKFITEVTLPSTLIILCDEAFWGCENLDTVIFGNDSTYVGDAVFEKTLIIED